MRRMGNLPLETFLFFSGANQNHENEGLLLKSTGGNRNVPFFFLSKTGKKCILDFSHTA